MTRRGAIKKLLAGGAAMTAGVLSACAGLSAFGAVVFSEDFTRYADKAPGTLAGEVNNEAIYSQRASLVIASEKDETVFAKPIVLPKDGAFDVLFSFNCAKTNAAFDVVFMRTDGSTAVVPVDGSHRGWCEGAVVAAKGELKLFVTEKNVFTPVRSVPMGAVPATVNFRVKAGEKVSLTKIVVRTSEPLATHPAMDQFAARASLERTLGPSAKTSDGTPIDLRSRSISFVAGRTGRIGELALVWDNGYRQVFPVAVTNGTHGPVMAGSAMPDLGLKPRECWQGRDAVVEFGRLATLHVRPHLVPYSRWSELAPAGRDLVRDWETLPSASKHVTTVEMREGERGFSRLWLDGSFAKTAPALNYPPKGTSVVSAELILDKGVAYRINALQADALPLWANPCAKTFAKAKLVKAPEGCADPLDSQDVGLCRAFMGSHMMTWDAYTSRTPLDGYPAAVHYRLPAAPYARAEILFALDDAPGKVPYLTVRLARYDGGREGVGCTSIADRDYDFTKGLPKNAEKVGFLTCEGKAFPLYRMTLDLPMGECLDYAKSEFVDLEFLGPKQNNLQQIDNSQKPRDDVRSAFNLFGVKLRTLDVTPELVQLSPGNVFTEDERVKRTSVRLTARQDGAHGTVAFGDEVRPYAIAKAGDSATFVYDFSGKPCGFYEVPVTVRDDAGNAIVHTLVACVTPESGRLAKKEESPYCTWWFGGVHGSPKNPELGGPLMRKAGIRKESCCPLKDEDWKKYDITSSGYVYALREGDFDAKTGTFRGNKEFPVGEDRFVADLKKQIASKPFVDHVMVWHESAPGCGQLPEELFGLAVPTNDVARERRKAAYVNEIGRICRKHFPKLKIQIGNTSASIGAVSVPLRGGAKPEYYDMIGQESPSQTIAPERLHDYGCLGGNVAKAVAKKITGKDIPTGGCFEYIYRCERDAGAAGEHQVAEWYVRDILISLMNRFSLISPGLLFDCTGAYCNTMWGVSGIVHRQPYVYPKKAYLAYAVLTKVLDGVRFVREVPTGSTTVYAAEFRRKDNKIVTVFWCARGEAELACEIEGEAWTMYGVRSSVAGTPAKIACGTSPVYVISQRPCGTVAIVGRTFAEDAQRKAAAKVAGGFSAANVTVGPDPDFTSTHREFLPILKPGAFTVKDVVDEAEGACLEVTLDTTTVPTNVTEFVTEFTTLRLKDPLVVPEPAALLGLRVKGNSNWGQLRFEIEDAKGEVFKGLSSGRSWGCDVFDWPGYLAVSFDGWGDVCQYTDVNDCGLALSPGQRIEQWVSSGGDKRIDWPVKIRAITVPMNRFKPTLMGFAPTEPSIRLKSAWYVPAK